MNPYESPTWVEPRQTTSLRTLLIGVTFYALFMGFELGFTMVACDTLLPSSIRAFAAGCAIFASFLALWAAVFVVEKDRDRCER